MNTFANIELSAMHKFNREEFKIQMRRVFPNSDHLSSVGSRRLGHIFFPTKNLEMASTKLTN